MKSLLLPTIKKEEIDEAVRLLTEKQMFYGLKCFFCKTKIKGDDIGGFIPIKKKKKTKVGIFCNKLSCKLDAFNAIKKHNGNGSPVIK